MPRWLKFILALLVGLSVGLVYGWLVSPLEYVDTTPQTLSADYRTDFVLMTAEVYAASPDLESAVRALAFISSLSPSDTVSEALAYAQAAQFAQADVALLQTLASALKSWQPGGSP
jgi:hypothetical protein